MPNDVFESDLFNLVHISVSILLIVTILVQVRGQGGGLFGSAEASFRTRRGIDLALFRFTIGLIALFIGLSIISATDII